MASEMNKNKWIDDVVGSTLGMSKAEPGGDFFDQVMNRINQPAPASTTRPVQVVKWAAAAILLLALNAGSILYFLNQTKRSATASSGNPLAAAMQSESTYNY